MKVLILEGIATSGKSTLTQALQQKLVRTRVAVFDEAKTHIPIIEQREDLHIAFFDALITEASEQAADLIIFDRLYLTQAFRASIHNLDAYGEIEKRLLDLRTLTVFLHVQEHSIAERVGTAMQHRDHSWGEYVKTKGGTVEAAATYYAAQQRAQLNLLKTSQLSHMICDTTAHQYEKVATQILTKLQ